MCGGRYAILYAPEGRFACRNCQRIAYQSQRESQVRRICRRLDKIEAKFVQGCKRPRGMHEATYERLLGAIERYGDEWLAALGRTGGYS